MGHGSSKVGHNIPYPEVENLADPDDTNSWTCSACRLPIFSTPFVVDKSGGNNLLLHDQCSDQSLPPELSGHTLHLRGALILRYHLPEEDDDARYYCTRCLSICGSKFYDCQMGDVVDCEVRLDLPCALSVTVLHRSHEHRLTAVKEHAWPMSSHSFVCSACGKQHAPVEESNGRRRFKDAVKAYACTSCDFWIHPDCALLPNAIVDTSLLVREAEIPNLLRLPMENEHASVMPRIMKTKTHAYPLFRLSTTTSLSESFSLETIRVHEHPLIYHHDAHNDIVRVCNACAQVILPPDPFYSCAHNNNNTCKDFFLHSCCSRYPKIFLSYHSGFCSFIPKVGTKAFNVFECVVCKRKCNGSAYYIEAQQKYMDVVCALMPHSITHDAHGKAHILQGRLEIRESFKYLMRSTCKCCLEKLNDNTVTSYACSNCRSFSIHPHCALLPDTISHKFDRHPLKLITSSSRGEEEEEEEVEEVEEEEKRLCEICEKEMDLRKWHYGCEECEQYFHANCIPCLDHLSNIKFGFKVSVGCHECPVACIRAVSVDGYRCGHCGENIRESDDIAFECTTCYFRMHKGCVHELMIKT